MNKVNNSVEQTVYYMLSKLAIPSVDKIKLIKLMFMADKYHLLNYGRTITDDNYYAMPHGPVGGKTFNTLNESAFDHNKFFILTDDNKVIKKDCKCEFELLSDTDKEAIEKIIEKFGKYETWDLVELTHKYPEWQKYKDEVKSQKTSILLKTFELVSCVEGDGFNVSSEKIKALSEMLDD